MDFATCDAQPVPQVVSGSRHLQVVAHVVFKLRRRFRRSGKSLYCHSLLPRRIMPCPAWATSSAFAASPIGNVSRGMDDLETRMLLLETHVSRSRPHVPPAGPSGPPPAAPWPGGARTLGAHRGACWCPTLAGRPGCPR